MSIWQMFLTWHDIKRIKLFGAILLCTQQDNSMTLYGHFYIHIYTYTTQNNNNNMLRLYVNCKVVKMFYWTEIEILWNIPKYCSTVSSLHISTIHPSVHKANENVLNVLLAGKKKIWAIKVNDLSLHLIKENKNERRKRWWTRITTAWSLGLMKLNLNIHFTSCCITKHLVA